MVRDVERGVGEVVREGGKGEEKRERGVEWVRGIMGGVWVCGRGR